MQGLDSDQLDSMISWLMENLSPASLREIYLAAERRLEAIDEVLEHHPSLPATTSEEIAERFVEALQNYASLSEE